MTTEELIDRISQLENICTSRVQEFDAAIDVNEKQLAASQPELWQAHQNLIAEKITAYRGLQAEIENMKDIVRADVLTRQETIRGVALMAVYAKPKTTWDGEKLKGFALAHPEVIGCANIAEQGSVSFRKT